MQIADIYLGAPFSPLAATRIDCPVIAKLHHPRSCRNVWIMHVRPLLSRRRGRYMK